MHTPSLTAPGPVQADAPAAGEASLAARRSKGSPKGAVGQWQEVPVRSSSPSASAAANGQHPRLEAPDKPFHGTQLLQFTKFSHLVPARVRLPPQCAPALFPLCHASL